MRSDVNLVITLAVAHIASTGSERDDRGRQWGPSARWVLDVRVVGGLVGAATLEPIAAADFLRSHARLLNKRSMPELLPPSRRRVRAARALGLRPQSGLLPLAGLALLLASLLGLWPWLVGWLSDQLARAFAGSLALDTSELAAGSAAGLLVLLAVGMIAAVSVAPHARARRALGVAPEAALAPPWLMLALSIAALMLIVIATRGALAGAARSVDASPEALTHAWLAWLRRGLLALAVVAACVGVIERQLSARRLWRALHQTPAQAREEARASGLRAPRKRP